MNAFEMKKLFNAKCLLRNSSSVVAFPLFIDRPFSAFLSFSFLFFLIKVNKIANIKLQSFSSSVCVSVFQ